MAHRICSRWSQEPIFKVWSISGSNSLDIADIEFVGVVVGGGGGGAKSFFHPTMGYFRLS